MRRCIYVCNFRHYDYTKVTAELLLFVTHLRPTHWRKVEVDFVALCHTIRYCVFAVHAIKSWRLARLVHHTGQTKKLK